MELTILGSGTGVPSLRRGAPGALLRVADKLVVIDMGSGTLERMLRVGVRYADPDVLLFTHLHPDHVADFVPFLFACKYSVDPRTKELFVLGGKGFRGYYEGLKQVYGHWVRAESFRLHLQEVLYGTRRVKDLAITTYPLEHTRYSVGYRIEEGGKVLAYSGDTDYCQEVVELGRGADLLVLECSFPEGRKVKGHLTPRWAGRIAREAGAKRLLLTHFYPPCDDADLLGPCREEFGGEILVAEDLMRVQV